MTGRRGPLLPGKRRQGRYKKAEGRLDFKHRQTGEVTGVVKGTNRRVVVVRSPDPQIFEEAIFIIREDLFRREGSAEAVLRQARQAAGAYLGRSAVTYRRRRFWRLPAPLYAGLGAAAAGIAWLCFHFVGV